MKRLYHRLKTVLYDNDTPECELKAAMLETLARFAALADESGGGGHTPPPEIVGG